jgi:uncharacterized membrane protein YcaP (DUF421 family)
VLFAADFLFVHLTYRSARARRLLEGSARVLLEDGRVNPAALRREAITRTELGSIARDRGCSSLAEVALIVLEPNGHIAVMGEEAAAHRRRQGRTSGSTRTA